ncbi:MAG: endolytic transglycosylase MltG, partial [Hansschlegelia sp.]
MTTEGADPGAVPARPEDMTQRMAASKKPYLVSSQPDPAPEAAEPRDGDGGRDGGGQQTPPPAPPRRKRRRDGAFVGYLSGLLTFLTLIVLGIAGALFYGKLTFDSPGPLAADTTVMISKNEGVGEIADALGRAGVVDQPKVFELGVRLYGANDKLRYGEYGFPAHVSMREAMEILALGKPIEHAVTIPEGLTSLQVVERLRDQPLLTGDVKETPPEGSLLPETYKFSRGAPREQVIARMQQTQKSVLEQVWAGRDPSVRGVKTPEDLVVLASLVEKETGVPEERSRVAAVFANRLARGMRLQSDPTIVYGIVGGRGTLGRSLTRADILNRTPYNTYAISGLPSGPITNPGRQALEAAAHPAKTSDLYFVADGTGGHAFAPTLAEHNRNVAKWRQLERSKGVP